MTNSIEPARCPQVARRSSSFISSDTESPALDAASGPPQHTLQPHLTAIPGIYGADLVVIWAIFGGLALDKRLYTRDAGPGLAAVARGQHHPVKLKPAVGLVRLGWLGASTSGRAQSRVLRRPTCLRMSVFVPSRSTSRRSRYRLRRRVATPRRPDRETVDDRTQGIQLARVQQLVDYWATDYDWRKLEARMKKSPSSSRRSTGSTSISSMSARPMRTRCR